MAIGKKTRKICQAQVPVTASTREADQREQPRRMYCSKTGKNGSGKQCQSRYGDITE